MLQRLSKEPSASESEIVELSRAQTKRDVAVLRGEWKGGIHRRGEGGMEKLTKLGGCVNFIV